MADGGDLLMDDEEDFCFTGDSGSAEVSVQKCYFVKERVSAY
jgi:hypothetical protein